MPTVLDGILESHDGAEPRVVTADVQKVLEQVIRPGEDDGAAVALIAERARVSTRTVYRVLSPDESKVTLPLDLADKLCIAAGRHLLECRLAWDGWPGKIVGEVFVPAGYTTAYTVITGKRSDNVG